MRHTQKARTLRDAYDAVVLAVHDGLDKVAQLVQVKGDLGDQAHVHHACKTREGNQGNEPIQV